MKNKNRTYYFGFGTQMDYPAWQNGLLTSLDKEKILDWHDYKYKNPFAPRLRRLLKDFDGKISIGLDHHTVYVEPEEGIRPVIYDITRKLIKEGWQLGDFNRNMAVDDIWEEHLEDLKNNAE